MFKSEIQQIGHFQIQPISVKQKYPNIEDIYVCKFIVCVSNMDNVPKYKEMEADGFIKDNFFINSMSDIPFRMSIKTGTCLPLPCFEWCETEKYRIKVDKIEEIKENIIQISFDIQNKVTGFIKRISNRGRYQNNVYVFTYGTNTFKVYLKSNRIKMLKDLENRVVLSEENISSPIIDYNGFELPNRTVVYNNVEITPIKILADKNRCRVEFEYAIEIKGRKSTRVVVKEGVHKDFKFYVVLNNIPAIINLKNGKIRKIRLESEEEEEL